MSKKPDFQNLAKSKEFDALLGQHFKMADCDRTVTINPMHGMACGSRLFMLAQHKHRQLPIMTPGSKTVVGMFMPEISAEGVARVINDHHVLMDEKHISMGAVPMEKWANLLRKELEGNFPEAAVVPRGDLFEIDSMLEMYPDCITLSSLFGEDKDSGDMEIYTPPSTRSPRDLLHMKQHGALDRRFKPQQKQQYKRG